jgi:glutamate-1-semialdehyde 2,1-aminomutase
MSAHPNRLGASPRARAIHERERATFTRMRPRSFHLYQRAYRSMPDAVPSGVCVTEPFPIAIERGDGAHVWDIDGNEYADFHNGFGVSVFGHTHQAITAAMHTQVDAGVLFGALTPVTERWAGHLCERYSLRWVRFTNSGSEAVADVLRLARAATGRRKIAKIEGCYHGSSAEAFVSNNMDPVEGPLRQGALPRPRLASAGIPARVARDVVVLPFNDLDAAECVLAREDVACLILEPVLFNVGAIWPEPGYLEGLRRLCTTYGTLLIFDEVKTGATLAWGGAAELFGVTPDLVALGKAIGGGIPVGAVGDCTGALRDLVEDWTVPQLGTFSGNPLAAAAGYAALTEVLTPDAYARLRATYELLERRLGQVIAEFDLPAYVIGAAAKGCLVWAEGGPLRDFRDYCRRFDGEMADLVWLYLVNRGCFLSPGQDEQFTISVAHGEAEVERFAGALAELAAELRA